MADKNPDKSYGWTSAQNFNDYMEGVIGTDLFSINACLWHHPSCPGAYGEELEKMRFDDEMNSSLDETDYLDCVKFCADLIWHGGCTCYFSHQQPRNRGNLFLCQSTKWSRRKPTPGLILPWWWTRWSSPQFYLMIGDAGEHGCAGHSPSEPPPSRGEHR